MLAKLLLLFVGLPLLEIMILIKLGQEIGFWPTLFLVVATGAAGATLARAQGLSIWYQIQGELAAGRMPAGKLVDGLLVLAGGIVLLTPGLITDMLGLALLVPLTRASFKKWLHRRFVEMSRKSETRFTYIIQ